MAPPMLLHRDRACLLVVDVQERLVPAMEEQLKHRLLANAALLIKAARRLEIPIIVSEQYRRGLGVTVPELRALVPEEALVEKQYFSCMADAGFRDRFQAIDRPQVVVAGLEAHVCVLQTVDDLIGDGRPVFVAADATASRTTESHRIALDRMAAAGATVVTTEMVVFEWLEKAGTPEFKDLSALVK